MFNPPQFPFPVTISNSFLAPKPCLLLLCYDEEMASFLCNLKLSSGLHRALGEEVEESLLVCWLGSPSGTHLFWLPRHPCRLPFHGIKDWGIFTLPLEVGREKKGKLLPPGLATSGSLRRQKLLHFFTILRQRPQLLMLGIDRKWRHKLAVLSAETWYLGQPFEQRPRLR